MCKRWAALLAQCPGSRLLIADLDSTAKRQRILDAFDQHGVSSERLEILPRADLAGYQRLFDRVDISLDTYPYGGGTTTIDSLWMGVPVVTATGELPVSRSAASILQLLGLRDWVASSIDAYVDCAARAAQDLAAIQRLRTSLRERLRNSPLMDEAGFARDFEAAMRNAWHRFCTTA
jgi:predicted O-linked N-acetylglucosamine transferase (SPINDLY family)